MLFFVCSDVKEIVVVIGREACAGELFFGHFADGAFVKNVLEVLEGKGVLEDVDISHCLTLLDRVSGTGGGDQQDCGEAGSELHGVESLVMKLARIVQLTDS